MDEVRPRTGETSPARQKDDGGVETTRHAKFARYVLPEVEVLLRVATSLTQQSADAEDLVQDTLIRAFRACDRFDGAHPRAWLLTILRNTHINRGRSRRPVLLHQETPAEEHRMGWPGAVPPPSPEDLVLGATFDEAVAQALTDLPEPFAVTIRLVDIDGLSYAEAAQLLRVPPGTVMSRLHRGRARIRRHLTERGVAPVLPRAHHAAALSHSADQPAPEDPEAPKAAQDPRGRRHP